MMPTEPGPQAPPENQTAPVPVPRPEYHWHQKLSAVLFITFCLELGIFLVIFPWTPWWDANYFTSLMPRLNQYWDNLYLRGAVSGLGFADLYISMVEVLRLRRFSKH